ncbi:MAG: hypothetical protein GXO35_08700 [Gammaproteobacteria bacterium]|nr:hypothetical protein [Gammaproteobacteria bacterium]
MAVEMNPLNPILAYQKSADLGSGNQANQAQRGLSETGLDKQNQVSLSEAEKPQSTKETLRTEQQASLVAHLFGDGSSVSSDSLKITYQAAIEKLNETLSSQFEMTDEGIKPISEEALKEQGGMEYWTPENTAKRIVDGATAFLSGFQAANPELEGEALMDRFIEVIGGGIEQGFDEAKGLLGDLKVLEGDIESNIEKTFSLVQSGLQDFRDQYLGKTETATLDNDVAPTIES